MLSRKKAGWLLAGITAVLVLAAVLLLPIQDISSAGKAFMGQLRDAGPVPFFLAMAFLPAIGFPLGGFSVTAGPIFAPTLGLGPVILFAIAATSANVALSYWIASRAFRPLTRRLLTYFGYRLPEIQPHNAWLIILLVRIVPGPPFFFQSYLLAVAKAPFGIYMAISTLVPASYIAATIMLGDALSRRDPYAIAIAVGIFVAVGAAIHFLRKRLTPPPPVPSTAPTGD